MTYDLARLREAIRVPKRELAGTRNVEEKMEKLIPGATLVGTSGFGDAIISNMRVGTIGPETTVGGDL